MMYDYIVIGAGMYGRYIARELTKRHKNVLIVAKDDCLALDGQAQGVASLVNQARVHNGYHYPRSITTAKASVKNYSRFLDEFSDATIDFNQVYAIPKYGSKTNARQFVKFCRDLGVKCDEYYPSILNKREMQGSWLTEEKAIDTLKMMSIMESTRNSEIVLDEIVSVNTSSDKCTVKGLNDVYESKRVINCTYANLNMFDNLELKYEACEIALFKPKSLDVGVTFMDGPFASFMPFNKEGLWSLTSVQKTPHFQNYSGIDDVKSLQSNFARMLLSIKKYLTSLDDFDYIRSEYVVKTINASAELDDSRLIKIKTSGPVTSVLGGKLDAIYELDSFITEVTHA